jgi:hypothetical protein
LFWLMVSEVSGPGHLERNGKADYHGKEHLVDGTRWLTSWQPGRKRRE